MTDGRDLQEESIGALFSRLIARGGDFARAEIAYVRCMATAKVDQVKLSVILAVVALFVVQASLTVLIAALGLALAHWLGLAGGMLAGALIGFAIVGGLLFVAVRRLKSAPATPAKPEALP